MNILSLLESQKEKNSQLLINTELPQYKLWARKNLELQIKLSALADETNCYCYLENSNSPVNKEVVFLKFIDFLSHVITIGLDRDYISTEVVDLRPNDYCLSDQFLNLYIDINDLIISPSNDHFLTLIEDTLSLGVTLGYCEDKIKEAFIYRH